MIKFKRRKLQCWIGTKGYDSYDQITPEELLFSSEDELIGWIKETLTFTSDIFPLEIVKGSVVWGGVLGWIEVIEYEPVTDIRAEKARITLAIKKLEGELQHLQYNVCDHPNATKVPNCNTGNWDRNDDHYWYECKCPDCGLYWTEDQ